MVDGSNIFTFRKTEAREIEAQQMASGESQDSIYSCRKGALDLPWLPHYPHSARARLSVELTLIERGSRL